MSKSKNEADQLREGTRVLVHGEWSRHLTNSSKNLKTGQGATGVLRMLRAYREGNPAVGFHFQRT